MLPPVYYPPSALPAWAQPAARLSPTTYAAGLLQQALRPCAALGLEPAAVLDWTVLVAFTAALFLIAAVKARWKEP